MMIHPLLLAVVLSSSSAPPELQATATLVEPKACTIDLSKDTSVVIDVSPKKSWKPFPYYIGMFGVWSKDVAVVPDVSDPGSQLVRPRADGSLEFRFTLHKYQHPEKFGSLGHVQFGLFPPAKSPRGDVVLFVRDDCTVLGA